MTIPSDINTDDDDDDDDDILATTLKRTSLSPMLSYSDDNWFEILIS